MSYFPTRLELEQRKQEYIKKHGYWKYLLRKLELDQPISPTDT